MSVSMGDGRLLGVQYLRGIGALMVGYFHLAAQFPLYSFNREWFSTDHLQFGVHIFFVISGFIMLVTTTDSTPGDFLRRRLIRVVPLYWVLTLALVVLSGPPFHFLSHSHFGLPDVVRSLAFVFYWRSGASVPVLAPGWTLNIEMFFYLTFTATLLLPLRRRVWILAAAFGALVCLGFFLNEPSTSAELWNITRPWMLEFVLGASIGALYLSRSLVLPPWLSYALIIGGFGALLSRNLSTGFFLVNVAVPSSAIVLGAVALEQTQGIARIAPLALLGDASYSLYLSHLFVFGALGLLWRKLPVDALASQIAFGLLALALAVIVAIGIYSFLERPLLQMTKPQSRAVLVEVAGGSTRSLQR